MEKLIGLKDETFEVIAVKPGTTTINPPFNQPVTIPCYNVKAKGNACVAENAIIDKLGDEYKACAINASTVSVYAVADLDAALEVSPALSGITINNAWYVQSLPRHIVAELPTGETVMFYIDPMRIVKESELRPYKGHHPRKVSAQPLPDYLYRFYGLVKNEETASEVIRVRLRPSEKDKLDQAARVAGKNVSEFVRSFVQGL